MASIIIVVRKDKLSTKDDAPDTLPDNQEQESQLYRLWHHDTTASMGLEEKQGKSHLSEQFKAQFSLSNKFTEIQDTVQETCSKVSPAQPHPRTINTTLCTGLSFMCTRIQRYVLAFFFLFFFL